MRASTQSIDVCIVDVHSAEQYDLNHGAVSVFDTVYFYHDNMMI